MIIAHEELAGRTGHEAGRALLEQLYKTHFPGEMPKILIAERGKPYFATGNVHFSISHTKDHVFCVLADREVGIDAEEADRSALHSALAVWLSRRLLPVTPAAALVR